MFERLDADKNGILSSKELSDFINDIKSAAGNSVFSKREVNKYLKESGLNEYGLTADDIYEFTTQLSRVSQEKQVISSVNENGNEIIEYENGNKEIVKKDGSRILQTKDENENFVTEYLDAHNNLLKKEYLNAEKAKVEELYEPAADGKTTLTQIKSVAQGGNPSTVITYENGKPTAKRVVNGSTTSTYSYENGQEVKLSDSVNIGNNRTKLITYKKQADGSTAQIITQAGMPTITRTEDKEIIKDENCITENNFNKEHKRTSQTKSVSNQTYSVEYDGQGNTKIVVQEGESPASIKETFGLDDKQYEKFLELNKSQLKGKAPNKYFPVGANILLPAELEADNPALIGRLNAQDAKKSYAQSEAQRVAERLDGRQIQTKEITVDKDYDNWWQYAREMLKKEGNTNPAKQQIADRMNELQILNEGVEIPKKGSKINVAMTPEEVQAAADKTKAKNIKEKADAKSIAKELFDIADNNVGNSSYSKMSAVLDKKVTKENIVDVLDAYKGEVSNGETLVDTICSEWGDPKPAKKNLTAIIDKLGEAAADAGVSAEDIEFAKNRFIESMNKQYSSAHAVDRNEMEKSIDFLRGAIAAKQQGREVPKITTKEAMEQFVEGEKAVNEGAEKDYKAARDKEGWIAKSGDWVCGLFGCTTIDDMDKKLGANAAGAKRLAAAAQSGNEAEFKKVYKEVFGIEFDEQKVDAREAAAEKLSQARSMETAVKQYDTILSGAGSQDYNAFKNSVIKNLNFEEQAKAYNEKNGTDLTADDLINGILKNYTSTGQTLTDSEKKEALLTAMKQLKANSADSLNKLTGGKSFDQMEEDLDLLTKSAYGTNDIAKDVAQFNKNQELTEAYTGIAVDIAGTIALNMLLPGIGTAITAARMGKLGMTGVKAAATLQKINAAYKTTKFAKGAEVTYDALKAGVNATRTGRYAGRVIAKSAPHVINAGIATSVAHGLNKEEAGKVIRRTLMNMSFAGVGAGGSIVAADIAKSVAPKLAAQGIKISEKVLAEIIEDAANIGGSAGVTKAFGDEYNTNNLMIDAISGAILARISHVGGSKGKPNTAPEPEPVPVPKQRTVLDTATDDAAAVPGGKLGREKLNTAKEEIAQEVADGITPQRDAQIRKEAEQLQSRSRDQGREIRHIVEDGTGVYIGKNGEIDLNVETDPAKLQAFRKEVAGWKNSDRDADAILAKVDERIKYLDEHPQLQGKSSYTDSEVLTANREQLENTVNEFLNSKKQLGPHSKSVLTEYIRKSDNPYELDLVENALRNKELNYGGRTEYYDELRAEIAAQKAALAPKPQSGQNEIKELLTVKKATGKGISPEEFSQIKEYISGITTTEQLNQVKQLLGGQKMTSSQKSQLKALLKEKTDTV